MKLWQAGIVVVASAGNFGPTPMSITVPGNTPYVITVGAMTDNWNSNNAAYDGIPLRSLRQVLRTRASSNRTSSRRAGNLMGIMNKQNQYLGGDLRTVRKAMTFTPMFGDVWNFSGGGGDERRRGAHAAGQSDL